MNANLNLPFWVSIVNMEYLSIELNLLEFVDKSSWKT